MSYVLDGGAHGHGMDELAELHLGHETIKFKDVAGSGKSQVTFDFVPLDKALDYAAEDAEVTLRLHQALKPRLLADSPGDGLRDPGAGAGAGADRNGAGRHQGRPRGAGAALQRLRQAHGRARAGDPRPGGPRVHHRLAQAARRDPVRRDGPARRQEDQDRRLCHRRRRAAVSRRPGPRPAGPGARLAPALQAEEHLYRRAAGADQPETGRVHTSYSQAVASTGRLSSNDPNLQNIPVRTEEGRKIRRAFVAEKGQ